MSQKKLQQAIALHARGEASQAAALFRRILKLEPANPAALHGLGMIAAEQGDTAEAVRILDRLVRMYPEDAALRNNYANALRASEDRDAALDQYAIAVRLRPDYAQAWCNRGAVLNELGQHSDALESFDIALQHDPESADAHYNRGNALHDLNRNEDALEAYLRAINLAPDYGEAWCNRGNALANLNRAEEALDCYNRAVELLPDYSQAWSHRGRILRALRRDRDALRSYDRAIEANPGFAEAWADRGGVLNDLNHPDAALQSCEHAMTLNPDFYTSWWNAATACFQLRRYEKAMVYCREALRLKPDLPYGLGQLLHAKQIQCDWDGIDALRMQIKSQIAARRNAATPFVAQTAALPPPIQRVSAEIYVADLFSRDIADAATRPPLLMRAAPRIRVGYVSGDLRNHPVGHQVRGLAKCHDRSVFEVVGVSLRRDDADPRQRELSTLFDEFHDVDPRSGADAVSRIQSLGLDLAVDLQGHTGDSRMNLFAAKLAPVQVNFLCPGTSGAPFFDYVIGDGVLIPDEERAGYTESVVTLPESFFVTDYREFRLAPPPPRVEQGLPESGIVFASLCDSYKITPRLWDVWMRLLRRIPDSVLWLVVKNGSTAMENLRREAVTRGVEPHRLLSVRFVEDRAEHLSRLALADICLDTFGYNGHTTTADALWAGVPVVTLPEEGFSARVAASLLHAAGMGELVARSTGDYESLAFRLATMPDELRQHRSRLASDKDVVPLFDTARTVRYVEAAYKTMVERYGAGLVAASFSVPREAT